MHNRKTIAAKAIRQKVSGMIVFFITVAFSSLSGEFQVPTAIVFIRTPSKVQIPRFLQWIVVMDKEKECLVKYPKAGCVTGQEE